MLNLVDIASFILQQSAKGPQAVLAALGDHLQKVDLDWAVFLSEGEDGNGNGNAQLELVASNVPAITSDELSHTQPPRRVLTTHRPVYVENGKETGLDDRNAIWTALETETGVMAVLVVASAALSEEDVPEVATFARLLSTALDHARLFETNLKQQARLEALANATTKISAHLDPEVAVRQVMDEALGLLDANKVAIYILEGEGSYCPYSQGVSDEYMHYINTHFEQIPGWGVLETLQPIHIVDAQTDPITAMMRHQVTREDIHTYIVLPMVCRDEGIGAMVVYRTTVRPFTGEEIALAQTFSNQAAVTVANAHAYRTIARLNVSLQERVEARTRELAQRNQYLAALNDIAAVASHPSALEAILQYAVDKVLEVTGLKVGSVWLIEEIGSEITLAAHRDLTESANRMAYLEQDRGLIEQAARSGDVVVSTSTVNDRTMADQLGRRNDLRSAVAVPLLIHDHVVGVLHAGSCQVRPFSPSELGLLSATGRQIGMAIENTRLLQEIQHIVALEERESLAHDLHDGLCQTLGYLILKIDQVVAQLTADQVTRSLGELKRMRQVIDSAYNEVRHTIGALKESATATTLETALQELARDLHWQSGIDVHLNLPPSPLPPLSIHTRTQLLFITREALANAYKHSQARNVNIAVALTGAQVQLSIQDDGQGFEPTGVTAQHHVCLGLESMRKRAQSLDGTLTIDSRSGRGTTITAVVPCNHGKRK